MVIATEAVGFREYRVRNVSRSDITIWTRADPNTVERLDGTCEFPLERAEPLDTLHERGHVHGGLRIEQLVSGAGLVRQPAGGQFHADAGDLGGRHQ